jgi:hypothetical protein
MSAIINTAARVNRCLEFISKISETATNSFYLGIGRIAVWPDENNPPAPSGERADLMAFFHDVFAMRRVYVSATSGLALKQDVTAGYTSPSSYRWIPVDAVSDFTTGETVTGLSSGATGTVFKRLGAGGDAASVGKCFELVEAQLVDDLNLALLHRRGRPRCAARRRGRRKSPS